MILSNRMDGKWQMAKGKLGVGKNREEERGDWRTKANERTNEANDFPNSPILPSLL